MNTALPCNTTKSINPRGEEKKSCAVILTILGALAWAMPYSIIKKTPKQVAFTTALITVEGEECETI